MTALSSEALIRKYRCAQCFGVLVEVCDHCEWNVVCPKRCDPGGFVSLVFAVPARLDADAVNPT